MPPGARGKPFMVVVCGGRNVERYASKTGEAWLRECRQNGIAIASLCTGAHVLAQARLLDDKRCVIHWENYPSFTERFAGAAVRTGLFEIDGAIHTCAGGAASFDMMLHLIRSDFGETVVSGVCEQAIVDRIRSSEDLQRMPFAPRAVKHHPVVARMIERMQETLADPLPVESAHGRHRPDAAADRAAVPQRARAIPGQVLHEAPAGAREAAPAADEEADRRGGDRLRLLVGLAFLEELSRRLREFPARGTRAEAQRANREGQREGIRGRKRTGPSPSGSGESTAARNDEPTGGRGAPLGTDTCTAGGTTD